jgi:hypothetical protein
MECVRPRGDVHLVGDGEDRLETDALLTCMRISDGRGGGELGCETGRTDEPTWVLFTCFGAPADVAYSLDVGGLKAKLVALEYDEAVLDPKAQCGDDVSSVRVVICVLNDFQ